MTAPRLVRPQWPVEIAVDARPHALNGETHRLVLDGQKAFCPQDLHLAGRLDQPARQPVRIVDGRHGDNEALEIVVIMLFRTLQLVMRAAVGDIRLGLGFEPDQDFRGQLAPHSMDDLRRQAAFRV